MTATGNGAAMGVEANPGSRTPVRVIRDCFSSRGLDPEFLAWGRPTLSLRWISHYVLFNTGIAAKLRVAWTNTFGTVAIRTTRR